MPSLQISREIFPVLYNQGALTFIYFSIKHIMLVSFEAPPKTYVVGTHLKRFQKKHIVGINLVLITNASVIDQLFHFKNVSSQFISYCTFVACLTALTFALRASRWSRLVIKTFPWQNNVYS